MPPRRRTRAKEAQLAFEALSIEGGLLSPEWLSKVAQLGAGAQTEADYRVPKGLNLRDEIGRHWRIAQAYWKESGGGSAERLVGPMLREAFGFSSLVEQPPVLIGERAYPIGHAALGGRVPVVIATGGSGLDAPSQAFGEGGRRRSAFGLAQEYLNTQEGALWGLATDGTVLRVLRDNASLTRPAWIEADLARIFAEERYADFAALWLLVHETRFGRDGQAVTECTLEAWRSAGREEGTRAREHLRRGVEGAVVALGEGFLAHPENQALRASLQTGVLPTRDYFNQLLRLVYRLIFLLTVEERGLLHPTEAPDPARVLYAQGYGMRRLRERSVKRNAHDRFSDLWEATKIVFRGLAGGEPRLGLPALAGIFASAQCSALDEAKLENRALLLAVFKLAWLREEGALARVNWRDMGPEELGSVYESLLELVPQITQDGRQFAFATGDETKGNARKTTGSYYTPDSLVQVLLDNALEPVIADRVAKAPDHAVEGLLQLSIVDPACGSGHFLLAAARRLASHIARVQANGTPSAAEYRHALRQVVGRCIYGVDLNPMAVELCKVSLWMEAVEPGLPLSFLDSHIQHGNALLGATPELMAKGIPDAAWDPIEGDDRRVASALKKRNKKAASGQRSLETLWTSPSAAEAQCVASAVAALETASDATPEALATKESQWHRILGSAEYQHQKSVADAWCAAFIWPKQPGELSDFAPTTDVWLQIRDGKGHPPEVTIKTVTELSVRYSFFHWHLQFPQVLTAGGFDVVLGNPPWDALRLVEKEFFAASHPEVAAAPTSAARKRLIEALEKEDPGGLVRFREELRQVAGLNAFAVSSGRYPLCGTGRVNLFSLFAEAARAQVRRSGRAGQILPSGIITDDSTKEFFHALVSGHELAALFHFENEDKAFPSIHHAFRFVLLVLDRSGSSVHSEMQFYCTSTADLADRSRRFTLSPEDIASLNPLTRTCPLFRTRRDATLTMEMYRQVPVLASSGWRLKLRFPLDMGRESSAFLPERVEGSYPLYEGKYFHQFDHRWMTTDSEDRELTDAERTDPRCRINPRHWYPGDRARDRMGRDWARDWLLAWRDISGSEKQRTFIATVLPTLAVAHSAWIILPDLAEVDLAPALLANVNSFVLDFIARQKVGGTHMSAFIVEQLPLLAPETFGRANGWAAGAPTRDWIFPRVLELTYTAWDLGPFARDVGYGGPPFRWDRGRRFLLRCELDAAFFHLYGLNRDDTAYVMNTFPIVRKNDEKAHGEYRTRRVILEIYDAMAEAVRTGTPYKTRLDPPPADPRVAHGKAPRS